MREYVVELKVTTILTYVVSANNEEEAKDIADDMYGDKVEPFNRLSMLTVKACYDANDCE